MRAQEQWLNGRFVGPFSTYGMAGFAGKVANLQKKKRAAVARAKKLDVKEKKLETRVAKLTAAGKNAAALRVMNRLDTVRDRATSVDARVETLTKKVDDAKVARDAKRAGGGTTTPPATDDTAFVQAPYPTTDPPAGHRWIYDAARNMYIPEPIAQQVPTNTAPYYNTSGGGQTTGGGGGDALDQYLYGSGDQYGTALDPYTGQPIAPQGGEAAGSGWTGGEAAGGGGGSSKMLLIGAAVVAGFLFLKRKKRAR